VNNTTRRYPRSTREAFPIERAKSIEHHPAPRHYPSWRIVLLFALIALNIILWRNS
jgi:hypothetical protein